MKQIATLLATVLVAPLGSVLAQPQTAASVPAKLNLKRDLPYAEHADPRQMVDIYAPEGAKNLPVVFWIHGGGWQPGGQEQKVANQGRAALVSVGPWLYTRRVRILAGGTPSSSV